MDLAFLTIAELGRLYRQRELSPVEVTQRRCSRASPRMTANCTAFCWSPRTRRWPRPPQAERELMAGARRGPLHGIPYALKDIIETAGIRPPATRSCARTTCRAPTPTSSTRLKAGGGVLMGKLATWEFALGGPSWDLPWPPARNPWNTGPAAGRLVERRRRGGGGRVRAGRDRHRHRRLGPRPGGVLRPRRDQAELWPDQPPRRLSRTPSRWTIAARLTRSAEDIALFLQVIAGFDPDDPGSEDVPVPDYRAALDGGVKGLRLGLIEDWHTDAGAHPDLAPAIDAAVEVLRGLGAIVEPVKLSSLRDYTDCKTTISSVELYAIHEHDLKTRPQDFGRILRNRVLPGALIRAEDYLEALRWRTALAQEQARALRQVDALHHRRRPRRRRPRRPGRSPTGCVSAPSITMPFSVGGTPALAIPCGFSRAEGLPLSLQIAAAPFAEATVLRIAHAYQQATDWHRRHPTLA